MAEFHDWDDLRAELDDGDAYALKAERVRTEAWVSAFDLSEAQASGTDPARAQRGVTELVATPQQIA